MAICPPYPFLRPPPVCHPHPRIPMLVSRSVPKARHTIVLDAKTVTRRSATPFGLSSHPRTGLFCCTMVASCCTPLSKPQGIAGGGGSDRSHPFPQPFALRLHSAVTQPGRIFSARSACPRNSTITTVEDELWSVRHRGKFRAGRLSRSEDREETVGGCGVRHNTLS